MNHNISILTVIISLVTSVSASLAAPYLLDRGYALFHRGRDRYNAKKDAPQLFCENAQTVLAHYKNAPIFLSDCFIKSSQEGRENAFLTFTRVLDITAIDRKYDVGIGINNKSFYGFTLERCVSTGREIIFEAQSPKYIDGNETQVFLFQRKDRPMEIVACHSNHYPKYRLENAFVGYLSPYAAPAKYRNIKAR